MSVEDSLLPEQNEEAAEKEPQPAASVAATLQESFAMLETKLKEAEEAIRSRDNEINNLKSNVDVLVGRVRKLAQGHQPKPDAGTETKPAEQPIENPNTQIAALETRITQIQESVRQKESVIKTLEQNLFAKIQDIEAELRHKEQLLVDRDKQLNELNSQLKAQINRMKKISSFLRQAEALARIDPQDHATAGIGQLNKKKETITKPQFNGPRVASALDPTTVSADFFDQIIRELSQMIGPMAPTIVRHEVAALGESIERFPRSRLPELLDIVTEDILDENLKHVFRERFVER